MLKTVILTLALATLANGAALARSALSPDELGQRRAEQVTRMRACGDQWKTAKADESVKAKGWPKYWSECNARMKGAATASQ